MHDAIQIADDYGSDEGVYLSGYFARIVGAHWHDHVEPRHYVIELLEQ